MNNAPYKIGELIALAITAIFCLGITWMIAVGTSNIADHMEELRKSSTHPKGVVFPIGREEVV